MDPFLLLLIGMALVLGGILWLRLPAFLALIIGALVVGLLTPDSALEAFALEKKLAPDAFSAVPLGKRVANAFGTTTGKIGILIAMASLIGTCLAKSGAADRIIRSLLSFLGARRIPGAMLFGGFTLGIPVFFDTVFYLMIPLARSMGLAQSRQISPLHYGHCCRGCHGTFSGSSYSRSFVCGGRIGGQYWLDDDWGPGCGAV